MKKLNVLIIGCGNIAGKFDSNNQTGERPLTHAGAYSQHAGFMTLACADVDSDQMKEFQSAWNIKEAYLPSELSDIDKEKFDVISICSPTQFHEEHLLLAAKLQPKLVFCEKPLTSLFSESSAIVNLYKANSILLAVNYTRRWDPELIKMREAIASNYYGKVRSIIGIYSKGILNNGSHLIDLLIFLFGSISVVYAGMSTEDYSFDDKTISGLMQTITGIPVHLVGGDARDYANFELQIITSAGVVAMENGGLNWRIRKPQKSDKLIGYKTLDQGVIIDGSYDNAMTGAIDNIYRAITNGDALNSSGETAMQAQQLCQKIYKSSLNH